MRLPTLTIKQREALELIKTLQARQVARDQVAIDANQDCMQGCTPSHWVFVHDLISVHRIRGRLVESLARKGYLVERREVGCPHEVRPVSNPSPLTPKGGLT